MKAEAEAGTASRPDTALDDLTSEVDVFRHVEDLASRFGYSGFSILRLSATIQGSFREAVVASNWPAAFLAAYDAMQPLKHSPIIARLRISVAPIPWSLDASDDTPVGTMEDGRALLLRHGFARGTVIPVHSADGGRAIVTFEGNREPLSRAELNELAMEAALAYDVYHRLKNEPTTDGARLSDREVQVLSWAANGKTSVEIATILSLSDHTVNSYLNSAMRKLDCVNRTQLVAKALRLRIIS